MTTSLFGHDSGGIALAAEGSIASGNDSSTLIQADSNRHSMAGSTAWIRSRSEIPPDHAV